MDALSPAPAGWEALGHYTRLSQSMSPCFTSLNLPTVLSPSTSRRPRSLVCLLSEAYRVLPLGGTPSRATSVLGFAVRVPARHDYRPNRVRCLRTSRSPRVASHLVSRRRSNLRLQSPDRTLAGTSTLPIQRAHRRTPGPSRGSARQASGVVLEWGNPAAGEGKQDPRHQAVSGFQT